MIGSYVFIGLVIIQRLIEIVIAKRNENWIRNMGGYEVGRNHYKYFVILHSLFFLSLIVEVTGTRPSITSWTIIPFVIFLFAQVGRIWALSSLGPFWNTRIMVLPGAEVIAKGPYRFMRHPNYAIVATELAMLPLIFQAYWTLVVFSFLNVILLSVRIKVEEDALKGATNYQEVFEKLRRFSPTKI